MSGLVSQIRQQLRWNSANSLPNLGYRFADTHQGG
jgi:hypothetical protein